MTRLVDALNALGLDGKVDLDGRWVTVQGERCLVYIVEERISNGYFTWCADEQDRTVEYYRDPHSAIQAGLSRVARRPEDSRNPDDRTTGDNAAG